MRIVMFLCALLLSQKLFAGGTITFEVPGPFPDLIGGSPVLPGDFPASVYASMGASRCTATLVNTRVLLMAAHCVSNNGSAKFSIRDRKFEAICTHHPMYRSNYTADFALCRVLEPVEYVTFETMDLTPSVAVNEKLLLTGYGCTQAGGGGGNDGIYRAGYAPVLKVPSATSTNFDMVTKGTSALCYGDSGGPVFKIQTTGRRVLVGINSRGDIRTISYLPALYKAKDFFENWAKTNNQKICGLHNDALNCR